MRREKDNSELLTIGDVCELLKIERTTLWRWRSRGEFPQPVKVNGYTARWRRSVVVRWMVKHYGHPED